MEEQQKEQNTGTLKGRQGDRKGQAQHVPAAGRNEPAASRPVSKPGTQAGSVAGGAVDTMPGSTGPSGYMEGTGIRRDENSVTSDRLAEDGGTGVTDGRMGVPTGGGATGANSAGATTSIQGGSTEAGGDTPMASNACTED